MNELETQAWRVKQLNRAIEKVAEGNQTEFARRLGYKDGAFIRQILNGSRPITEKTVAKIECLAGMKGWFSVSGPGSETSASAKQTLGHDPSTGPALSPVPVIGQASLSDDGQFVDVSDATGYVDLRLRSKGVSAVRCLGDDLKPRIQHGEFIVIDPNHKIEAGDDVLLHSADGKLMVKRFLYCRDGRIHVVSINDAHPAAVLDEERIEKIYFICVVCHPSMWRASI